MLIKKKIEIQTHTEAPVTRRDFLAKGLIAAGATVALPTLLSLSVKDALARAALTSRRALMDAPPLPMMVFDMAGGMAMPSNFLVGGMGGSEDLLESYSQLGWDPREAGALDRQFGIPMSAKHSRFLAGILASTSPEARANLRMGGFCHFADIDTSGNPQNAASLVLKASQPGSKLANGMGLINSVSGGNSAPALSDAALKPTFVTNVNDYLGAMSFGGEPFQGFSVDMLRALAVGGKDLAKVQVAPLSRLPGGEDITDLAGRAYSKGEEMIEGVSKLDPRIDPTIQQVYKIAADTAVDNPDAIGAMVSSAVLTGIAGPSTFTIGDFDYHDGTQETSDRKDMEMGVKVGQAIELAYRLKQPFFFQCVTDGGCSAVEGTRQWQSDAGDKTLTVIGFYHPKAAPRMLRTQVGHYTNGQGSERSTLIGSSPQLVAYAVFANYLNCLGRLGEFHSFVPDTFKEPGQLESVLIFEGMPS
jgi:hypothetical protein